MHVSMNNDDFRQLAMVGAGGALVAMGAFLLYSRYGNEISGLAAKVLEEVQAHYSSEGNTPTPPVVSPRV